ncbi:unnamed protein product [Lasius platythorax]|uniref:Uncharacterized protein n=1 Tax=Lasius platythorax TaxID=488582 RepID=A0AAV2NA83_9HYME
MRSIGSNGNDGFSSQKSLKRPHSRFVNAEESRNNSNNGESERKSSRPDYDWTKQYESMFVFGSSDLACTVSTDYSVDIQ